MAGYANDIPAKRRFEGQACGQVTDLTLNGYPASEAIYLSWEVSAALPVTATWRIEYDGPPGMPPSPITGLIEPTRAYTLTGLTNYSLYHGHAATPWSAAHPC